MTDLVHEIAAWNWWSIGDEGIGFGIYGITSLILSVHGWMIGHLGVGRRNRQQS